MNWFLGSVAFVSLLATIWLAWRYYHLRRQVDSYSDMVHQAANENLPSEALPEDEPGILELSNAVKALVLTLQTRNSDLEAERVKLASVLEQMTDGVLIADADGQVTYLNPAAARLFGSPAAEGRSVAEILRLHQLVEVWQHSQESGQAQSETVEVPSRRLFLQLYALPDVRTGGSLLLVQDLTPLRRMETVRRDFISNVSHELRTPLASLKALTETLRDGALNDPSAAPRFLSRIETEVDALTQMTQELLDLSRIESGQVSLELKNVQPSKLLYASAERMRTQVERAGLSLDVDVPADMPEVQADAGRLEQVLVNLIHNAVKFTHPGGNVSLSGIPEERFIRFSVQDTGVGIPEEDLPRIFERFYKADRARSGGGTGLGLSICRHIVEAHGGKIWAESVEGKGSTFFFTIPVT